MVVLFFSVITEVTLFPEGGYVKDVYYRDVVTGVNNIVIDRLIGNITPENLSINVKGKGSPSILDFKIEKVYEEITYSSEIGSIRDSLEKLENKLQKLNDELKIVNKEKDFLNSIISSIPEKFSKDIIDAKVNTKTWEDALNYIKYKFVNIGTEERKLLKEKERIEERIESLKRRLQDISPEYKGYHYRVSLKLKTNYNGKAKIILEYPIENCGWGFKYRFNGYPDRGRTSVEVYGEIYQRTGINWKDVKLTLSTTRIQRGTPPEPQPWYIHYFEPRNIYAKKKYKGGLLNQPQVQAVLEEKEFEETGRATVEQSEISQRFNISGKVSLKSGDRIRTKLTEGGAKTRFVYYSYPQKSEDVYVKAMFKNPLNIALSPSDALVYIEDEFTGLYTIPASIAPQDSIILLMGRDNKLRVKRVLKRYKLIKGGPISSKDKLHYRYEITLKNNHESEREYELVERIPVSTTSKVEVKVLKIDPKVKVKEDGIVRWKGRIGKGEKKVFTVEYEIVFPKGRRSYLRF